MLAWRVAFCLALGGVVMVVSEGEPDGFHLEKGAKQKKVLTSAAMRFAVQLVLKMFPVSPIVSHEDYCPTHILGRKECTVVWWLTRPTNLS